MNLSIRQKSLKQQNAGFTILEVLVVLTIIALVSAVIGPRLVGYLGRAKSETASLQIKQINSALQLFYIDLGRYPSEAEGLRVMFEAPGGDTRWEGPYLESASAITDPWGRDYLYQVAADAVIPKVISLGRDGQIGGTGEDTDIDG